MSYPDINDFDFDSNEGIRAIPIPDKSYYATIQSPAEAIENILQRRATLHARSKNIGLVIECLRKSNEIMLQSKYLYTANDYLRLVNYLRDDKQNMEADAEEKRIKELLPDLFKTPMDRDRERLHTILTEGYFGAPISYIRVYGYDRYGSEKGARICSIFCDRVYSIDGKDTRFPRLPKVLVDTGTFFPDCSVLFNYWFETDSSDEELDVLIKSSNRPFVDCRPQDQINHVRELFELRRKSEEDMEEYNQMVGLIGDIMPKAFQTFQKHKTKGSEKYQGWVDQFMVISNGKLPNLNNLKKPLYQDDINPLADESNYYYYIPQEIPTKSTIEHNLDDILGIPLEERRRLQAKAIDEDDGEWEKELDARNSVKAGIERY